MKQQHFRLNTPRLYHFLWLQSSWDHPLSALVWLYIHEASTVVYSEDISDLGMGVCSSSSCTQIVR